MGKQPRPQSALLPGSPEIRQYLSRLKPTQPEYELKLYPLSRPKSAKPSPHPTETIRLKILEQKSNIQREKDAIGLLQVAASKAKQRIKAASDPKFRSEKVKTREEIGVLQMRIRKAKTAWRLVQGDGKPLGTAGEPLCRDCEQLRQRERHLETHPTVQSTRQAIAHVRGQLSRCTESTSTQSAQILQLKTQLASVPALAELSKKRKQAKKELKRLENELEKEVDVRKFLESSWPGPEVVPEAPVVYGDTAEEICTALHTLQAWDTAPSLVLQHLQAAEASNLALAVLPS